MISLTVNGKQKKLDVDPDTPLLWVLRDHLALTGTKYGCGIAQCGACMVHLDGKPIGTTPIQQLRVAPGTHKILLENRDLGKRRIKVIKLRANEHMRLAEEL